MFQPARLGLLAILCLILLIVNLPGAFTKPLEFPPRSPNTNGGSNHKLAPGKLGAVASESSVCSGHGTKILESGGNAADAVGLPLRHVRYELVRLLTKEIAHCN